MSDSGRPFKFLYVLAYVNGNYNSPKYIKIPNGSVLEEYKKAAYGYFGNTNGDFISLTEVTEYFVYQNGDIYSYKVSGRKCKRKTDVVFHEPILTCLMENKYILTFDVVSERVGTFDLNRYVNIKFKEDGLIFKHINKDTIESHVKNATPISDLVKSDIGAYRIAENAIFEKHRSQNMNLDYLL